LKTFNIDDNVSGRFSVLSNVGLVPLAIVGIDIEDLLLGDREIDKGFFSKNEVFTNITSKAQKYVNSKEINSNCIFSYFSGLEDFNKWYVQLWAESLGKID
jgi:glucose-6-phosphate isomerase